MTYNFNVLIPPKTRFIAQDWDGRWHAYQQRPDIGAKSGVWLAQWGEEPIPLCVSPVPNDATKTLIEIDE